MEAFLKEGDRMVLNWWICNEQFDVWWRAWLVEVFDSLMPYKKWKKTHPNLAVGDICLVMMQSKLSHPSYKMCKVNKLYPDANGVVRIVRVLSRPRDS